jgi:hypothetical protein
MGSIYDRADTVNPTSGIKKRDLLPEGVYPEVMIVDCREVVDKTNETKIYYAATVTVIDPGETGVKPGTEGDFFVQIQGSQFKSYDAEGMGCAKQFVGAAFGYESTTDINEHIKGATIAGTIAGDGTALSGHVVRLKVWHKKRPGKDPIGNYETKPVCVDGKVGQPKIVRGAQAPAAASAPVAAPPPPPPPAAPVAGGFVVPPGWALHTSPAHAALGWIYELANPANQRQLT